MQDKNLSILTLERLKQKKRSYIILLTVFAVLLSLLMILALFMYFTSGLTPLLAVPLGLLPMFVIGCKKLRAIYKEIEFRAVSSEKIA